MSNPVRPRRRDPGRSSAAAPQRSLRYRQLLNPFEPVRLFSEDQVESMHLAALDILERQGMRVLSARGRDLLRSGGATVDETSQMVRLAPQLVSAALASVPEQADLVARNPDRSCRVGGRHVVFAPVAGPPSVSDLQRGRRTGSLADFCDFVRLSQAFDVIHVLGQMTEPQDVVVHERHLQTSLAQLTLGDKVPYFYCRGDGQLRDCFEMLRITHGIDEATFQAQPRCYSICNTNSPLQLDLPMTEGIIEFAAQGQLMIVTPFTLAGAMAPVTIAGALTQQNAEALAGLVLAQLVRPGSPFVYGGFTSNVDMKSGAPAFGTPEYMKTALIGGQLARRYGLPYRSSNTNAANSLDAQAAYESVFSLWGAVMGGVNLMMHGAGWMEGGLQASFEKMALDADLLAMVADFLRPVSVEDSELALEAMREVGPGGHFFGAEHTKARYRTAFYAPMISDWRNYETWREAGSPTAYDAAHRLYKERLEHYVSPPMEADRREALEAFVARRKAEGGVKTDF
jgi:trimethylamine--corrinoid protein Co-methyltransferase